MVTSAMATPSRAAFQHDLIAEHLRDEKRQLEALLGVQPRIAGRLIPARQVRVRDVLRAAETLGDVFTRDLDVDAAWMGAQRAVHFEEALHLIDDAVEMA